MMRKNLPYIFGIVAFIALLAYAYFWHYLPKRVYPGEFEDTVALVAKHTLQRELKNSTPDALLADAVNLQKIINLNKMSSRMRIKLLQSQFPRVNYDVTTNHRAIIAQGKRNFLFASDKLCQQVGASYQELAEIDQGKAKCLAQVDVCLRQAASYQEEADRYDNLEDLFQKAAKEANQEQYIKEKLANRSTYLDTALSLMQQAANAENNKEKYQNLAEGARYLARKARQQKQDAIELSTYYQQLADCYDCVKNAGRVEKNYTEATKWYTKAAKKGNLDAQITLWRWYAEGEKIPQDHTLAAEWMLKAAEQDNRESQIQLWKCYKAGRGVDRNMAESAKWMTKAAEKGDVESQYTLAGLYETGNGVTQDITTAAKWHLKAALNGHTDSQTWMGFHYYVGEGVTKDYNEAVKWFTEASEEDDVYSMVYLGICNLRGEGTATSTKQAFELFNKASDNDLPDELTVVNYFLGYMYENGLGVRKDTEEAFEHYKKASDKGIIEAQLRLGQLYETGEGCTRNINEAIHCYQTCVQNGIPVANLFLANCYLFSTDAQHNSGEAFRLYNEIADQGLAEAQFDVGYCYYYGEGTALDIANGVEWFRKAAANGSAHAKFALGNYYFYGNQTEQNLPEAINWYKQAAEEGNTEAQMQLGYCYLNGDGLDQSDADAQIWFGKAAENGSREAKNVAKLCYDEAKELTNAQATASHYDAKQNKQRTKLVKDSILLWCNKHAPMLTNGNIDLQHQLIDAFKTAINTQYDCKYATQEAAYKALNVRTEAQLKQEATETIDAEKQFQVDFDKVRADELANIKKKYPLYKPKQTVQISFNKANMSCNYSGAYMPQNSERMMIGSRIVRYSDLPEELRPRFSKKLNDEVVEKEITAYMTSYKHRFEKKRSDAIAEEHTRLIREQAKQLRTSGMVWVDDNNLQWRTPAELVEPTLSSWRKSRTIAPNFRQIKEASRRANIVFDKQLTRPTQCSVENSIIANAMQSL